MNRTVQINDDQSHDSSGPRGSRGRSRLTLTLLALGALLLFVGFVALGSWQVHRLAWKEDLIARVSQRVHAAPLALPPIAAWPSVTASADEYRHVHLHGQWLRQFSVRVRASTVLGRGFWLMTPLQIDATHHVWVNRGFITDLAHVDTTGNHDQVELTGLLRISEPGGTVLQSNQPERNVWFSRDIAAMSKQADLATAAPFFVDADAQVLPTGCAEGQCGDHPVGGLTVLAFPNNHLVYSMTWYGLALLVIIAAGIVTRTEYRLRHRGADNPHSHQKDTHD